MREPRALPVDQSGRPTRRSPLAAVEWYSATEPKRSQSAATASVGPCENIGEPTHTLDYAAPPVRRKRSPVPPPMVGLVFGAIICALNFAGPATVRGGSLLAPVLGFMSLLVFAAGAITSAVFWLRRRRFAGLYLLNVFGIEAARRRARPVRAPSRAGGRRTGKPGRAGRGTSGGPPGVPPPGPGRTPCTGPCDWPSPRAPSPPEHRTGPTGPRDGANREGPTGRGVPSLGHGRAW